MGTVTKLLSDGVSGNSTAFDTLYQLLYAELRGMAHSRIRRSGDLTLLDTTSLVHEAFLRFENKGELAEQGVAFDDAISCRRDHAAS